MSLCELNCCDLKWLQTKFNAINKKISDNKKIQDKINANIFKLLKESGIDVEELLKNYYALNEDDYTKTLTSEDDIKNLIDTTKDKFGRIDILLNNAGLQHVANIEDFPTEKYKQMIDIMLVAPFLGTKYVLPIMKEQLSGTILNMSSINGIIGFSGKAAYNSAKHGIIGLTKVTALEAAEYGITVNALCPGYADTQLVRGQMEDLAKNRGIEVERVMEEVLYPLIPQKRLIDIKEIADYAMFLASDSAKGVTGQSVVIDGGYTVQ